MEQRPRGLPRPWAASTRTVHRYNARSDRGDIIYGPESALAGGELRRLSGTVFDVVVDLLSIEDADLIGAEDAAMFAEEYPDLVEYTPLEVEDDRSTRRQMR